MSTGHYLRQRARSFMFAFQGVAAFLRSEPHARIHAVVTVLVIVAGWYFRISVNQWIAVLIVTGMVWITEMLNTVIEKIMDHLSPEYHPQVKWIKDVAAGAVLVAAIVAAVTGFVIFVPMLLK
ncbi:MAG TPA: diacylglycerol kinase family protein [Chitinophaga sp.]|nr:diacylglycerol kinase family protein [Chitinophaga sp.]